MTIEKSLPNMVMVCVDGAITSEDHIRGDKKQLKIWRVCVILLELVSL